MNILFYGTKKYDEEFFDAILPEYPELSIHYLEANLSPETAALAAGYEAICAFVNANILGLRQLNSCIVRALN